MKTPLEVLKEPLSQSLDAVGKLRSSVLTEILKLPAPDPLRKTLQDVDLRVSSAELELTEVIRKLGILRMPAVERSRFKRILGLFTRQE